MTRGANCRRLGWRGDGLRLGTNRLIWNDLGESRMRKQGNKSDRAGKEAWETDWVFHGFGGQQVQVPIRHRATNLSRGFVHRLRARQLPMLATNSITIKNQTATSARLTTAKPRMPKAI